MLSALVAIAAVVAAALAVPAFAQQLGAAECGPPTILIGAPGNATGVPLAIDMRGWHVTHHLLRGDVRREDQYAMQTLGNGEAGWVGYLKRRPTLIMKGRVHGGTYEETLLDIARGNRVIMDAIAVCQMTSEQPSFGEAATPAPDAPLSENPMSGLITPQPIPSAPPAAASISPQTPQPSPLLSAPAPAPGSDSVPIVVNNGSEATVEVLLGQTTVGFTIETGAEVMSLPKIIADGLIADGSASEAGTTLIKVADGRVIEERRIIIDRVQIGVHVLRNIVATAPNGAMLLLPFTILNQMGKFTIDTANHRLIFG
jgi:hypothetical protein